MALSSAIMKSAKIAGIIAACEAAQDESPGFYISQHEWDKFVNLKSSTSEMRAAMHAALVEQVPFSLASRKYGVSARSMNIVAGNLWFKVFEHRYRPTISRLHCSLPLISIDNETFAKLCDESMYGFAQRAGFYMGWVAGFEFRCVSGMRVRRTHMTRAMKSVVDRSMAVTKFIPEYRCFNCGSHNTPGCCNGLITNQIQTNHACLGCGGSLTWLIPWRTKWSAHVTWVCGQCLWRRNMMLRGFSKRFLRQERRVEEIFDKDFIEDAPLKSYPGVAKSRRLA